MGGGGGERYRQFTTVHQSRQQRWQKVSSAYLIVPRSGSSVHVQAPTSSHVSTSSSMGAHVVTSPCWQLLGAQVKYGAGTPR